MVVVLGIGCGIANELIVRNIEPSFLDLIYHCSPVASLMRNKHCLLNDADTEPL